MPSPISAPPSAGTPSDLHPRLNLPQKHLSRLKLGVRYVCCKIITNFRMYHNCDCNYLFLYFSLHGIHFLHLSFVWIPSSMKLTYRRVKFWCIIISARTSDLRGKKGRCISDKLLWVGHSNLGQEKDCIFFDINSLVSVEHRWYHCPWCRRRVHWMGFCAFCNMRLCVTFGSEFLWDAGCT